MKYAVYVEGKAEMHQAQSQQIAFDGVDTRLHFAIMEYETWMMALMDNFIVSKGGDPEKLFHDAGVDYHSDFENTIYHPYNKVQAIYRAIQLTYKKHEGDQFSFLSSLRKEDYETLRYSGRCESFKIFMESLLSGIR